MKKLITGCIIFLAVIQSANATGDRITAGGRSISMGGTSVAEADLWSVCNNQAGIAWMKNVQAGVSFRNNFLMEELMHEQFGFILPLKTGSIGLMASRFGSAQFNEIRTGLSFAKKIGRHFSAGIQLDYLRIHLSDIYGNKNLGSCEIGLLYQSGQKLGLGVHLVNPFPIKITLQPVELLPSTLCIGLSYRFSGEFLTTVETEKDLENPLILRIGAEYQVAKPAWVRIGISTGPMSFTFGFGLEFGRFRVDMASGYHQSLGFSPSGSISYTFN